MTLPALTPTERRVLDLIRCRIEADGYPPTVREIAEELGYSGPGSVQSILVRLQTKGYLTRDPRKPRAIKVTVPDEAGAQ